MRPRCVAPTTIALLLAISGCADHEKTVDETNVVDPIGFGCLARADEVADDPLDPPSPPFCRIGLLTAVTLNGKLMPQTALIDRGSECLRTAKGFAVDLAPGVAARVHQAFNLEPGFTPIAESPACPISEADGPVPPLPDGAANAVELVTVATIPTTTAAGSNLILPAAVEARLIEAGSGRVLWHDTCRTDTAELKAAATFPDIGNMRRVLSGEAERCAQGFAASLGAQAPL